jgi:HEAT repeat protein
MQCEEVREQFAGYVIDQLDEPTRATVARHLMTCPSCRAEAEELRTLWASLGAIPPAEPNTAELRSRFQIMLEAYRHGLDQAPARSFWQTVNSWLDGWWPRQPALQFGLSVALLIAGLLLGRQFQPAPAAPGVAPPNTEVTELRNEVTEMRQMVALSLMQQQSASDRIRGVNWAYQLQKPGSEFLTVLLDTLMHDPSVNVRLATVDALRQFGDQPVVRRGVVQAMSQQQSPMVQIALIDLAVDLKEKESIDALRQLTQNEKLDGAVRERAQKGISELE